MASPKIVVEPAPTATSTPLRLFCVLSSIPHISTQAVELYSLWIFARRTCCLMVPMLRHVLDVSSLSTPWADFEFRFRMKTPPQLAPITCRSLSPKTQTVGGEPVHSKSGHYTHNRKQGGSRLFACMAHIIAYDSPLLYRPPSPPANLPSQSDFMLDTKPVHLV